MALNDVNFNNGDGQNFIVEVPLGTLNNPLDILIETNGNLLLYEIPLVSGGPVVSGGETSSVFVT